MNRDLSPEFIKYLTLPGTTNEHRVGIIAALKSISNILARLLNAEPLLKQNLDAKYQANVCTNLIIRDMDERPRLLHVFFRIKLIAV